MRSSADQLAEAFAAATGHTHAFTTQEGEDTITVKPVRLIELPFAPALLVSREIKDGCHMCSGALGVYYLRRQAGGVTVTARYPDAVKGWGWGAAPSDWRVTTRFTANPAIYATGGFTGGFTGQGVTETTATLTELRPAGPITSDIINIGFSDAGAVPDDDPAGACDVDGKIVAVVPDRSFDVAATGSVTGRDRYIRRGDRFVARRAVHWDEPCPPRAAVAGSTPG